MKLLIEPLGIETCFNGIVIKLQVFLLIEPLGIETWDVFWYAVRHLSFN